MYGNGDKKRRNKGESEFSVENGRMGSRSDVSTYTYDSVSNSNDTPAFLMKRQTRPPSPNDNNTYTTYTFHLYTTLTHKKHYNGEPSDCVLMIHG
jgi:hypothetical protein